MISSLWNGWGKMKDNKLNLNVIHLMLCDFSLSFSLFSFCFRIKTFPGETSSVESSLQTYWKRVKSSSNLQHFAKISTIENELEGKKLNSLLSISLFSRYNSFCHCASFYFTEFPPFQRLKNKAFPERFRSLSSLSRCWKRLYKIFFPISLTQMWQIATANRSEM